MVFKGYGFITDSEGKEHFAHHSSIIMDGFRHLNEDDIVNFELGTGKNGREQAISVQPVLTMKMVRDSLKEGNLFVKEVVLIGVADSFLNTIEEKYQDRVFILEESKLGMEE